MTALEVLVPRTTRCCFKRANQGYGLPSRIDSERVFISAISTATKDNSAMRLRVISCRLQSAPRPVTGCMIRSSGPPADQRFQIRGRVDEAPARGPRYARLRPAPWPGKPGREQARRSASMGSDMRSRESLARAVRPRRDIDMARRAEPRPRRYEEFFPRRKHGIEDARLVVTSIGSLRFDADSLHPLCPRTTMKYGCSATAQGVRFLSRFSTEKKGR